MILSNILAVAGSGVFFIGLGSGLIIWQSARGRFFKNRD